MKDSLYLQKYQLKDGTIEQHYVWLSKLKKTKHKALKTRETLTFHQIYDEPIVSAPGIVTMTKSRVASYKKKRNTDHFKKEIYPTFPAGSLERKHFSKKHGMKE